MFELQQYLQHPATSAQNADSAPRTIPTIFRMAVVDSKQERGKIRQSDSYCMYFAPLDPVYASPNKFWNEQKLARFRLSFTRDPRKRARFCPDQKYIWTRVNNTAICKSIWTVPSGAPNGNFRENICSEDDLRSRIFGAFVVKFLACLPLLGFSNIYKMV